MGMHQRQAEWGGSREKRWEDMKEFKCLPTSVCGGQRWKDDAREVSECGGDITDGDVERRSGVGDREDVERWRWRMPTCRPAVELCGGRRSKTTRSASAKHDKKTQYLL